MGYSIHINLKEHINTKKIDVSGVSWYKNQYWNSDLFNRLHRKQIKRDFDHDEMGFDTDDAFRYSYKNWRAKARKLIRENHEYSEYLLDVLQLIKIKINEENIKPKYIIVSEW